RRKLAKLAHLTLVHLSVALAMRSSKALALNFSRRLNALANDRRRFARRGRRDLFRRKRRHFDLQIDPIEQRSGNFRQVAQDLRRRANALAAPIVEESARTWIQRRGQRE